MEFGTLGFLRLAEVIANARIEFRKMPRGPKTKTPSLVTSSQELTEETEIVKDFSVISVSA